MVYGIILHNLDLPLAYQFSDLMLEIFATIHISHLDYITQEMMV
jgi:hypothetical protein